MGRRILVAYVLFLGQGGTVPNCGRKAQTDVTVLLNSIVPLWVC